MGLEMKNLKNRYKMDAFRVVQILMTQPELEVDDVVDRAGEENSSFISKEDILSDSRKTKVSALRQGIQYVLRERFGLSYQRIGWMVGGKHHATVIYSCKKFRDDFEKAFNHRLVEKRREPKVEVWHTVNVRDESSDVSLPVGLYLFEPGRNYGLDPEIHLALSAVKLLWIDPGLKVDNIIGKVNRFMRYVTRDSKVNGLEDKKVAGMKRAVEYLLHDRFEMDYGRIAGVTNRDSSDIMDGHKRLKKDLEECVRMDGMH